MLTSNVQKFKALMPIDRAKLPANAQPAFDIFKELTEGFSDWQALDDAVKEDEEYADTLALFLDKTQSSLKKNAQPETSKKQSKTVSKASKARKKVTARKAPAKKTRAKASASPKPQRKAASKASPRPARGKSVSRKKPDCQPNIRQVQQVHPAVRLIKRFVSMHGREKSFNQFRLLKTAIDKAMATGEITAKSYHYPEIAKINDRLVKVLDKVKDGEFGVVRLGEDELFSLVKIVGAEKVYESVRLINAYLLLQGRNDVKEGASKLLDRIGRARKSQKVQDGDPFFSELSDMEKSLNKYVKGKSRRIEVRQNTLAGLQGIQLGCACQKKNLAGDEAEAIAYEKWANVRYEDFAHPEEEHSLMGMDDRQAVLPQSEGNYKRNDKPQGTMSIRQARLVELKTLNIKEPWRSILGDFSQDSSMMVRGKGGQGKTTFNLMLAQYFADHHGSVAYVSSEEFGRGTFKEVLNRLDIHDGEAGEIVIADHLHSINPDAFAMVIIDSKDNIGLTVEQFVELKKSYPSTFFVIVSQSTKDGDFTGRKAWEHECDINVRVESFHASTEGEKNRWGGAGTMKYNYKGQIDTDHE